MKAPAGLELRSLPPRLEPGRALMCRPDFFAVKDVKNPFMRANLGAVDAAEARRQWDALKAALESLGLPVEVLEPQPGLEDMVFAANQALPGLGPDGRPFALMANMRHEARRPEVAFYRAFFASRGYRIVELPGAPLFEGQGDALWHPGRRLLWLGWGQRSSVEAAPALAEATGVPVLALELRRPEFYHLDTCLCLLAEDAALACREAFTVEGWELLRASISRLIEAPEDEALSFLACNGLAVGRRVVLQRGAERTCRRLREAGFEPLEVETGEFLKSGGSVFCLKALFY